MTREVYLQRLRRALAGKVSGEELERTVRYYAACLDEAGLRPAVLASLLRAIQLRLDRRTGGALSAGAILFSNVYGELGRTETAREVLQEWETAFSMA